MRGRQWKQEAASVEDGDVATAVEQGGRVRPMIGERGWMMTPAAQTRAWVVPWLRRESDVHIERTGRRRVPPSLKVCASLLLTLRVSDPPLRVPVLRGVLLLSPRLAHKDGALRAHNVRSSKERTFAFKFR